MGLGGAVGVGVGKGETVCEGAGADSSIAKLKPHPAKTRNAEPTKSLFIESSLAWICTTDGEPRAVAGFLSVATPDRTSN
jgi:hypothetical protein